MKSQNDQPMSDFQRRLHAICDQPPACHCPKSHEAHIANTPAWLRRYFVEIGRDEIRAYRKESEEMHK